MVDTNAPRAFRRRRGPVETRVYDIIRRAVQLGFNVNLISNGLALQSERNYRNLMNTGLRFITFSLDGKDAAIHDRHRGTPGLHQAVTELIRRIKGERPAMCVSLICIIMRETAPKLAEYAQWAEEVGVDRVMFQPLAESLGRPEKRAGWQPIPPLGEPRFLRSAEETTTRSCGLTGVADVRKVPSIAPCTRLLICAFREMGGCIHCFWSPEIAPWFSAIHGGAPAVTVGSGKRNGPCTVT